MLAILLPLLQETFCYTCYYTNYSTTYCCNYTHYFKCTGYYDCTYNKCTLSQLDEIQTKLNITTAVYCVIFIGGALIFVGVIICCCCYQKKKKKNQSGYVPAPGVAGAQPAQYAPYGAPQYQTPGYPAAGQQGYPQNYPTGYPGTYPTGYTAGYPAPNATPNQAAYTPGYNAGYPQTNVANSGYQPTTYQPYAGQGAGPMMDKQDAALSSTS
ncbi:uncharacterized protein MONOS_4895 [Monocercomonoides exilis]|uniref:uncharacterized protein n=1 Tax=Monocercomonoides exilis TaxID=2049356 RepID=UPI00355A1F87|nr:hypothetical protein MONOS_4895 [Monocercomonoides exilis]|eukprot:MONOS_4895.1-p1 / transcript=MONOS_4895.1 / gene=MONOS_4895 / organism=Monocercomonoides_exilis_PA203 / gene_product=unspecified product / transcript_product=unspecified product / location=Mono_scaffold00137:4384-5019(+) / protein_length=212 / sequence_SO=supercontig / SO=protein_coding / is_pseudo=false